MRGACWITNATHTHTICNAYCFSTATNVARTRLSVTLHVHCLSCSCFLTTPDHHTLIFNVRYTWPTSILKLFHNTGACQCTHNTVQKNAFLRDTVPVTLRISTPHINYHTPNSLQNNFPLFSFLYFPARIDLYH